MSKESLVVVLGALVAIGSFLGVPGIWKEFFFAAVGGLLIVIGLLLRRAAFFRSIENADGERAADAFAESPVAHQAGATFDERNGEPV